MTRDKLQQQQLLGVCVRAVDVVGQNVHSMLHQLSFPTRRVPKINHPRVLFLQENAMGCKSLP